MPLLQLSLWDLPRAADVLRESLYRGADRGVLVTDRALASPFVFMPFLAPRVFHSNDL